MCWIYLWRYAQFSLGTSELHEYKYVEQFTHISKGPPECSPSPQGSYQSPGCWCLGLASQSSQWGRQHLPGHLASHYDSCSTETTLLASILQQRPFHITQC